MSGAGGADGGPVRDVAVVGAGAIGGVAAAVLAAESPHRVTVCLRPRADGADPISRLEIRRPDGTRFVADPRFVTDPAQLDCGADLSGGRDPAQLDRGPERPGGRDLALAAEPAQPDRGDEGDGRVDLVLLATKAYQSPGAKSWLDRLCRPGTVVAVLQNGIDQVARVSPLAPGAEVIPVVVMLAADRMAPDEIHQANTGLFDVPATAGGHLMAEVFDGTSLKVRVADDFLTSAWGKLLINAVVGATGALALKDISVMSDPHISAAALVLAEEVVAVGRAEGAAFAPDAARRMLDQMAGRAPGHLSSIAADRKAGRPLEWEVRNAVVSTLGRRHGIPTPLNDYVTAVLKACSPAD